MDRELLITMLTEGRNGLVRTAQTVPADRLSWHPLEQGRTILNLLGDAAQRPHMMLHLLSGKEFQLADILAQMRQERANWTRDECIQKLDAGLAELCDFIRAQSDEALAHLLSLGISGSQELPVAGWILTVYRAFVSRFAQINYIQTLYGDLDLH